MKNLKFLFASLSSILVFVACGSNLPEPDNSNTTNAQASRSDMIPIPTRPEPFGPAIGISATRVALREGEWSDLTSEIFGFSVFVDHSVNWRIEAGGAGSLLKPTGSSVIYQAPTSRVFGQVVRITATSVAVPTLTRTIFISVNPVKASIAAGGFHALALKTNSNIFSWGANFAGQLGTGVSGSNQAIPVDVLNVNHIVAVCAGDGHSLALTSSGLTLSWGTNTSGQLGNNDPGFMNQATRVIVPTGSNVIAIAAGGNHSMALTQEGTILGWGNDHDGELGNDTVLTNQSLPVMVRDQNNNVLNNIVAIAAGVNHSLALKSDGTVLSWGDDYYGELGNDAVLVDQPLAVAVSGVSDIIAIAAGNGYSLALKSNGTLLSWGKDENGQLGNNIALLNQPTRVAVSGASNIVAITAGYDHSLALKSDGTLLSWGSDERGQLGNDTVLVNQSLPVAVSGASNIVAIAAGNRFSLALKSTGTMLSWGHDFYGQLGNDATLADQYTPVSVSLGTTPIRTP
jgi:alpha-tubulin suppressor-like RCC1 family protein